MKLIVKPSHLEVTFKPGVWAEMPRLLQAIKNAGFPPIASDVRLTVSGVLRKENGQFSLELDEMKKPLSLPLSVTEEKLRGSIEAQINQTVILEGIWQAPVDKGVDKAKVSEKLPGLLQVREVTAVGTSPADKKSDSAPKSE